MLTTLKDLMQDATDKGYAVGAFNTVNIASIRAVISAAEALDQPVILQHAELHEDVAPLALIGPVMLAAAKAATVPVCVHLDHGTDIEYAKRALEMGFTSVMFDGSSLSYDDNVAGTKAVVLEATKYGASVEAELGRVLRPEGGGEPDPEEAELTPEDCYTKAEEAKAFSEATGIDALAIAFGTAHGVYDAEPKLDFERISEIKKATGLPLVMHGGSGIGDDDFKAAIEHGITKVNYFTYMSLAGGDAVRAFLAGKENTTAVRFDELDTVARLGMQAHASHAIGIFGGV